MNTKNLDEINNFCLKRKNEIVKFLFQIIKIKSYSSKEEQVAKFILNYLKSNTKKIKNLSIKKIKNNLIIIVGDKLSKQRFLFDAHIDTVPAENKKTWLYPPFSGKIIKNKIYGRGSCDDKASVTALVFTTLSLLENKYNGPQVVFSLSSEEENSSGNGISEVLKYVKPQFCVICEPSDLKIVHGHRGKWSIKIKFYGKSAHSSLPQLGKNAIHSAYPVIKNIIEQENKNFIDSPLGKPTFTITYIESKTNSLNSIPHECTLYIDYRSVVGETEKSVKEFLLKNIKEKNYEFIPIHKFFPAWILKEEHQLILWAKESYKTCFKRQPNLILWQFCTNGSITMAEYKIPTIGFGPGNPFLAHQDNEYVKIEDVISAIKFYYSLITLM
jgi:putative selenium metabolism hydrolase